MSRESARNVSASIRQRLLDRSRKAGRTFNEVLQYFAMERFLFRLSMSPYANRFILKGAMMLSVWHAADARSTMDIDVLGKLDNAEDAVKGAIREILATPVSEDGIAFLADTIEASRIAEDADYHGIRVTFRAQLDTARVNMKVDIGFGDVIFPSPERLPFPTILALPAPELLCYSRESAIAEKCQAMVKLGSLNSRMKDFYDIWLLSRQFDFDAAVLGKALRLTFERRSTSLAGLGSFSAEFAEAKQRQWMAFRSRMRLDHAPAHFADILGQLSVFLCFLGSRNQQDEIQGLRWKAPGPWEEGLDSPEHRV